MVNIKRIESSRGESGMDVPYKEYRHSGQNVKLPFCLGKRLFSVSAIYKLKSLGSCVCPVQHAF